MNTLQKQINSFEKEVITSSEAFQIYRDLDLLEEESINSHKTKVLSFIQPKQLIKTDYDKLSQLLRRQDIKMEHLSFDSQQSELLQLLDCQATSWKVEYYHDKIALITNKDQKILILGKLSTAKVEDFEIVQKLLSRINKKPHVIAETQPITMNTVQPQSMSLQNENQSSKETLYYEAMRNKISQNDYLITLTDKNLLQYLQSQIMDPDFIYLKNDIAYMRQSYPQINPPITLFYLIAKQFRDALGTSVFHLIDLPQNNLNQDLIQNYSLEHFQNLLQICNHLTLIEKLRYLNQFNNTQNLPCGICNPKNLNPNHPIPNGYMNIIDGDKFLYNTKISHLYTLSKTKKILKDSKQDIVICCGEQNFIPMLNGIIADKWSENIELVDIQTNQINNLQSILDDPLSMIGNIEKTVVLDSLQQLFAGDYLEHIIQNGMPANADLFSIIAQNLDTYQQELSLEPLIQNLSDKDQSSFSNLLDQVDNGCLIDEMIFMKKQNLPSARVNKIEKNQVLRILRDFCN